MKRFVVFGYDKYYPLGGMNDFIKSFDTKEEASLFIKKEVREIVRRNNYYIVDMERYK